MPYLTAQFARESPHTCDIRIDCRWPAVARWTPTVALTGTPVARAGPDPQRSACLMAPQPSATTDAPALRRTAQLEPYRRALQHMPGGTDSNFRAWGEQTV